MATIGEIVAERLRDDSAVGALVGDRIRPNKLEQSDANGIAYQVISSRKNSVMGSDTDAHPRVQVTCWGSSYKTAVDTAEAVKDVLQRSNGTFTVTATGETLEIKGAFVETELDRFDEELQMNGRQVDFRFTHPEA